MFPSLWDSGAELMCTANMLEVVADSIQFKHCENTQYEDACFWTISGCEIVLLPNTEHPEE